LHGKRVQRVLRITDLIDTVERNVYFFLAFLFFFYFFFILYIFFSIIKKKNEYLFILNLQLSQKMIHEFLSYVQEVVVSALIETGGRLPGNYYLLDLSYLFLNCFNFSFSTHQNEDQWDIPHSTMGLIFDFWDEMVLLYLFYFILITSLSH
jgi:hypothetical protein